MIDTTRGVQACDGRQARGVVGVKDLALGKRLAADIASNAEWKAQPAQHEVDRVGLAATVAALLERAGE